MKPQEWIESTKRRWDSGHLYEGAQHLAAALEEIARLQAQLAQAERVVPECGYRFNTHCLCAIPSSRVLKDGEVAVLKAEWEAAGNLLFSARTAWVECETSGECDMSAVTKAAKAWDALRAQGKESTT